VQIFLKLLVYKGYAMGVRLTKWRKEFQVSSYRFQVEPNENPQEVRLEFGDWDLFGIWCVEFGI
jgi:hypothetical protein